MPLGEQLVSIEGEAGPSLIRLIQVHAFITGHNELGILGRICKRGAAESTAMCIKLNFWILLDGQGVALNKRRQEAR